MAPVSFILLIIKLRPTNAYTPIAQAVRRATVILPHQGLIENFVHHNPLENLQNLQLENAIDYLKDRESYISPGERTFRITGDDPRKREKLAIVDIAAVFLDRGAARWTPAFRSRGFLYFFAALESRGVARWRSHARKAAVKILCEMDTFASQEEYDSQHVQLLAERIVQRNLEAFGIAQADWDDCILSMLFKIKGWAGMFHHMEVHPQDAPPDARVSLLEFCAVLTIVARSAIESIAKESGAWNYQEVPLAAWLNQWPVRRKEKVQYFAVNTASRIAKEYNTREERSILEQTFKQKLVNALSAYETNPPMTDAKPPEIQFVTCIDDRMESFRRHLEQNIHKISVETLGVAGNFALPIRYKSFGQQVALDDVTPNSATTWDVEEIDNAHCHGDIARYMQGAKFIRRAQNAFDRLSFSPPGSLLLLPLAPFFLVRLLLMGFAPIWEHKAMRLLLAPAPEPRTSIAMDISPSVAAENLAKTFQSSGIGTFFAPIVVVMGHGSSSVNNPYSAGYNCGACAGKKGGPNARTFAHLANDPAVRSFLSRNHDIDIPPGTYFVAGYHDTTSDTALFYDTELLPVSHVHRFNKVKDIVLDALGRNALERCGKFLLSDARTPKEAIQHVLKRSMDYAEVRPELNHATNAGVIIGRRSLTRNAFFDRRVFLTSYDPFLDDKDGTYLEAVLERSLVVCSGINLEYLFSTLAIERYGAGTKAPLNIVGNIGMQQGTSGDLRTGLPSQMVDMHVPVRALFVVDAPFKRVQKVLARNPELDELPRNNWVHLTTRDPATGQIYDYIDGKFVPIPLQDVTSKSSLTLETEGGSFQEPLDQGRQIRQREDLIHGLAMVSALLSFLAPFQLFGVSSMMNPHGALIASFATGISLPVIAFSRRYLHGEFIFGRTAFLCVALILGFNLVSVAPSLEEAVEGWGLFGFASTFLIGSYNDRITVRKNAIFAFAAYRISDMALLTAVAFGGAEAMVNGNYNADLVAGSLIVAAMLKSSQFPLTALFSRSMEGPTPTSALGYAGLSAHIGLVLLSSTVDVWMPIDSARVVIAAIGITTAIYSGLLSQIHADRKGALAYATASTIGLIYVVMAAGYPDQALGLAFAHAAIRMVQILRAPSALEDSRNIFDLGSPLWPEMVPDWLYGACWALHRFDTDFSAVRIIDQVSAPLTRSQTRKPETSQPEEAAKFATLLLVAGLPFTPVADAFHEVVIDLLPRDPLLALLTMLAETLVSVISMRFILVEVLGQSRNDKFSL